MLHSVRHDARHAARGLIRSPAFTLTAILSLAIGVGGTAAIFSLVQTLLLSAPPGVGNPDRVVHIGSTRNGRGLDNFSYQTFGDYRDRNSTLAGIAGMQFESQPMSLAGSQGGEAIQGGFVSGNFFTVLEARPALGRFFLDEEDRTPRTHAVSVLSHRFWSERFDADPSIVGRSITLNGVPFTVVGVAAERFHGASITAPDLWVPMMAAPWFGVDENMLTTTRFAVWMMAVGRLKPGVSVAQAEADLANITEQLKRDFPQTYEGHGVRVARLSLFPGEIQRIIRLFMTFLFILTGLVLAIAGANVAGMLLARAAARRREIAVRLAIGASRARLVQQLLTESALLFAVAGVAGAIIAKWLLGGLMALLPVLPFQLATDFTIDWRVVLFALGVAIVTGVIAGLAPALQSTRPSLAPELRSDIGGSPRRQRLRSGLLVTQMAFSMLLLVVAGLFGRALTRAQAINPGFDPRGIHLATLDFGLVNHTEETGRAFATRLLNSASGLPGVERAALSRMLPLTGGGMGLGGMEVEGRPRSPEQRSWEADWNIVTPAYFDVMRIPLVSGRGFTEADGEGSPAVAIINQRLATQIWPDDEAVGKTFRNGETVVTIIGVARDSKYRSLGESPRGFIYVPFAQRYHGNMTLLLRTTADAPLGGPVRRLLADLDPNLPILTSQTMEAHSAVGLFPQRVALWVAGSLGAVALLLALLGIYGVTAYGVAQRTREIGIRIALGSSRRHVLRMVIGQGVRLAVVGVILGMGAAVGVTRLLEGMLYGVSGVDPLAIGFAGSTLIVAALFASWTPARRAANVDPLVAIRME